jgi:two-component system CheB/CheR fusion protein
MLQVVIGLCNQTLHRSADLKAFEAAFLGRMQALGRAYELLSRENWRHVSLAELAEKQLAPFATKGARYAAEGPDVEVRPNAALALGLVLYELSTNATKYGALSTKDGSVSLRWAITQEAHGAPQLVVTWVERGGPPVAAPLRTGFGTELVKRQLRHELAGDAVVEFKEEGLEVTLTLPARDVIVARPHAVTAG